MHYQSITVWFQALFMPPLRVLFSFRSRYYCAIGLETYLELEVYASQFTRDIQRTLIKILRYPSNLPLRGYHPLWHHVPVNFVFVR